MCAAAQGQRPQGQQVEKADLLSIIIIYELHIHVPAQVHIGMQNGSGTWLYIHSPTVSSFLV